MDATKGNIYSILNGNKQGHFVGSIVNIAEQAMPTGVQKYMIIDGQQRMATLTLLLIALGRWENGDAELFMEHTSDVDNVMEIIEQ